VSSTQKNHSKKHDILLDKRTVLREKHHYGSFLIYISIGGHLNAP
jgi:hypothetical protein